jgi:Protein of unknown function (DUF998)
MTAVATERVGAVRVDSRLAGLCGLAVGPVFVTTVVLLTVAEYPFLKAAGWSVFGTNPIPYPSYTARGEFGYVQTANFAVTGLLVLGLVQGLAAHLHRWTGVVGRLLLTVGGLAICASVFTTDRVPGPVSWHGAIHRGAFLGVLLGTVFGMLFAGLALRHEPRWRRWGTGTALLAGWQAAMFLVGGGLLPGDSSFYLFLIGLFGWLAATGWRLRQQPSSRPAR